MDGREERTLPLSISDILAGTAVVAVSLGLVRALPSFNAAYVWIQIAVTALIIVGVGVIVFLPGMIFVLRTSEGVVGAAMFLGYVMLLVMAFFGIGGLITNSFPPVEAVFASLWCCFVFAVAVGSPLFVWRACGYWLVWPGDGKRRM